MVKAQLDQITQMDDTLAQARELTHGFLDLIRRHSGEGLDTWLNDMRASTVREFLTFARSVERDKTAILACLILPFCRVRALSDLLFHMCGSFSSLACKL
jgi:transposase